MIAEKLPKGTLKLQQSSQSCFLHELYKIICFSDGDQIELTEEEVQKVESEVQQKLVKNLRKEIYHWKPLK